MPRRSATRRGHGRAGGLAWVAPLLAVAATSALAGWGCYGPEHVECKLRCGDGRACPAGTTCGADNFCHRDQNAPMCPQPGDGGIPDGAGAGGSGGPGSDGRPADGPPGGGNGDGPRDAGGPGPGPGDGRPPDGPPPPDGPRNDGPPTPTPDGPPVPTSGWRVLAAGARHTCGINVAGQLSCWGDGRTGALGSGANTVGATPRAVPGTWLAVAAGDRHSCGIREGGTTWCWGANESGQLGIGSNTGTSAPTMVAGGNTGWTAIAAAGAHTCARRGGELWCWGSNAFGELGIASSSPSANAPARVGAATDWTAVSTGANHTCGLRAGGLYCWGDHGGGRLGAGALSGAVRAVPANPVGGAAARWASVAAGGGFTCGVRTDGSRWCWGHNNLGQLGCDQGTSCAGADSALEPARGDDRTDWDLIAAGETHACGRRAGQIECWGVNEQGQAGRSIGPLVVPRGPVPPPPSPFISLVAGDAHVCAGAADGTAWCWGSASHGQIGDGSIADRDTPVPLVGGLNWQRIAAGWGNHACGITVEGRLYCWGAGNEGQLGNGRVEDIYAPTQLRSPALSWTDVDTGLNFSCGTAGVGVLFGIYCWGSNTNGETGSTRQAPMPTRIDDGGTDNWAGVSVGRRHACAVRMIGEARTVWCWGANNNGQAGVAPSPAVSKPTQVGSFTDWKTVDAGDQHTCGLRNGELWCWGGGSGTPVRVGAVNKWVDVAVGGAVACAIQVNDPLFDQVGELECGSPAAGGAPVGALNRIGGLWFRVQAGKRHACAHTFMPGTLECWGENRYGQLGTGSNLPLDVPENVRGDHSFLNVSVGEDFTCGVTRTSGLCWGRGHRGQLGDGQGSRFLPERVKGP